LAAIGARTAARLLRGRVLDLQQIGSVSDEVSAAPRNQKRHDICREWARCREDPKFLPCESIYEFVKDLRNESASLGFFSWCSVGLVAHAREGSAAALGGAFLPGRRRSPLKLGSNPPALKSVRASSRSSRLGTWLLARRGVFTDGIRFSCTPANATG
jgi:hypothetical protein